MNIFMIANDYILSLVVALSWLMPCCTVYLVSSQAFSVASGDRSHALQCINSCSVATGLPQKRGDSIASIRAESRIL